LSLRLRLTELSADRVFTESEFHMVGAATVKAWDATEVCTSNVIFVNENENKNGEKQENNEFVNEN